MPSKDKAKETESNGEILDRVSQASMLADAATEAGLIELANKLAPLIQMRRFDNVIDLLSAASDVVDMADDAMIQKLMKAYEEAIGAAWTLGNAARFAHAEVSNTSPPSLIGLIRASRDEDVRRGLHFALRFLAVLGRQTRDI